MIEKKEDTCLDDYDYEFSLTVLLMIGYCCLLPIYFDGTCVYPVVIAAHPSKAIQFALGLTDGDVHVLGPLKSKGKWVSK